MFQRDVRYALVPCSVLGNTSILARVPSDVGSSLSRYWPNAYSCASALGNVVTFEVALGCRSEKIV